MTSISIDPKSREVIIKIKGLDRSIASNTRKAFRFIGKQLKATAVKNILKKGRNGRQYKYQGAIHIASEPGESWANRSGKAKGGLFYRVINSTKMKFGNTVDYAKFLELGTFKMAPRPAHLISIKQNRRNIVNAFDRNIRSSF